MTKNNINVRRTLWVALGILIFLILPFCGHYYTHVFILVFLNIILASSYRLLYISGSISFSHASFYAIGGYTSALLATRMGFPFPFSFLAAGLVAMVVAVIVGWVTLRIKGPYFLLVTFSFFVVVDSIIKQWRSLTKGPAGITVPSAMGLESITSYYFIALVFMIITVLIMYRISKIRFGAELTAIGEDDNLAESIGINVLRHKVMAFGIGALFAGMAGSIYAHYMRFIAPSSFGLFFTVFILVWCAIGGTRKVWGPVAGATLLTLISEFLRMSGTMQGLLYAFVLLAVIMIIPEGLIEFVDTVKKQSKNHRFFLLGNKK